MPPMTAGGVQALGTTALPGVRQARRRHGPKRGPLVAVGNKIKREFFSARIGCQVYQRMYGMDLAALCIRP
jgi:hypothetical protein